MRLKPIDSPELLQLVAGWLSQKENYQWLDFGSGKQALSPEWLKVMTQRDRHVLRVYTVDGHDAPIGVVGLDDVNRRFKTARLWGVAGVKAFSARGYATLAASKLLTFAFQELGLNAVYTWVVDGNPSARILTERLGFRVIGRQRRCHDIDGRPCDRLWFDLLAPEHQEL